MRNIFSAIILVFFIPFMVLADSWIKIDIGGWDKNALFNGLGWIHKITLLICLLLGPWQFLPSLYRRNPMLHFALGNVYTMVILLLAGPTTVVLSLGQSNYIETILLGLAGALAWWCTRKGIFYISEKRWLLHLKWMMYSYAFVLSIVYYLIFQTLDLEMIFLSGCLIFPLFVFVLDRTIFSKYLLKRFTGR